MKLRALGVVLLAGACSGSPGVIEGSLTADEAAQTAGVEAYLVRDSNVEIYGQGGLLGVLSVQRPNDASRVVRIEHGADAPYENEVTRPLPDGSFRAPVGVSADELVLADPALAPFFAKQQLRFETVDPAMQEPIVGLDLETLIPACGDITFAGGCYPFATCGAVNGGGTLAANHTFYGYSDQSACEAQCNSVFPGTWGWIPTGTTECRCYSQVTLNLDRQADCPAVSCNSATQMDRVQKTRTCLNPGSCSSSAQGWTGICDYKPKLTLTVSGASYSFSTVSSPTGIYLQGSGTQSAYYSAGTAVTMYAGSARAYYWYGTGCSCSQGPYTSMCSVTMNSDVSCTLNVTP